MAKSYAGDGLSKKNKGELKGYGHRFQVEQLEVSRRGVRNIKTMSAVESQTQFPNDVDMSKNPMDEDNRYGREGFLPTSNERRAKNRKDG